MKLKDAEKTIKAIEEMLLNVQKHPDIVNAKDTEGKDIEFKLKSTVNRTKEKDGSFNIVIELRRSGVRDWKCLVIYFAEHTHGITTLVVNGILHNIVFENSTMNSPTALLSYLPDIILSDVKYLKECKPSKPKATNRARGNDAHKTGKKPFRRPGTKQVIKNKRNGSQTRYKKSGDTDYKRNSSTYKQHKKEY